MSSHRPQREESTMNALEKKLASAIEELIGQVIGLHPDLKKPLAKIQRVLRKMGA